MTAALAADNTNKDKIPVLTLLQLATENQPQAEVSKTNSLRLRSRILRTPSNPGLIVFYTPSPTTKASLSTISRDLPQLEYIPGSAHDKTKWALVLTNNIFSVIVAMVPDGADYADQYNAAQQTALLNAAANEAYTVTPLPNRTNNFAEALNNVAIMAGGQHSPDPLLKQ
jgi:hypothetical protein